MGVHHITRSSVRGGGTDDSSECFILKLNQSPVARGITGENRVQGIGNEDRKTGDESHRENVVCYFAGTTARVHYMKHDPGMQICSKIAAPEIDAWFSMDMVTEHKEDGGNERANANFHGTYQYYPL